MIKTKIVATLGPASSGQETITQLIDNGVDVFRLNFSHGNLDGHTKNLKIIEAVRENHTHTVAVLGDLCGPKIRTSRIEPDGQPINAGETITILANDNTGTAHCFGTNHKYFINDVEIGQRICIDDGQLVLYVISKDKDSVKCRVDVGGLIHSRKGINLPDSHVSIPSITECDWKCVDWAIKHQITFLALSFVRSAKEIQELKNYIKAAGSDIKVVAKIEKPQAIDDLENIIKTTDIILIARGDLGVEMDLAEVPILQKRITNLCRKFGKPCIVATQMLQSMIHSPMATRAEVSDVANAIMDFTDAVMLSGETAVGKYPITTAQTIGRIAQVTEEYLNQYDEVRPKTYTEAALATTAVLARSVAHIVDEIDAKLVAVWSETGSAARLLSKARIDVPILSFSSNPRVVRQMTLDYGVIPRCKPIPENIEKFTQMIDKQILSRNWAKTGQNIVIVAGHPIGLANTTNAIIIHTIGEN
ncbi:MAG: pyruvate kinase [Phycisphaerae bacterium]|nr:pyruvate kinase [Phycisphaerae bacterium]